MMLVEQQNERVMGNKSTKFEQEDYLQRIRTLYNAGQMSIASDVETFDKEHHDGLLYSNGLCLRRNRLSAYFSESTTEEIVDFLEEQGVLETGRNSRTKQISKLGGMRFYVIPLNKL